MGRNSQIEFYSLGLVAEDKPRNTDLIQVIPIEVTFSEPTKVAIQESFTERSHDSLFGKDCLVVKETNTITARWWKFNSHQVKAPEVCKEDNVLIYRLGKTDVYFWMDLGSANVKRLEDTLYAWAADPNNQMADDLSNAYVLNVSSMDKHITLRTSCANEEAVAYVWQFNLRDGTHLTMDDRGNRSYINSLDNDLGFENAEGSKINVRGTQGFVYAKEKVTVETEYLHGIAKKVQFDATESFRVNSPKSYFSGDISYGGQGYGKGTFTMPEAIIGNITFTAHVHTEKGDGKDTSAPK
ncbi:MAG: hypothetical protein ACRDBQ_18015 [Shewanella sp.]